MSPLGVYALQGYNDSLKTTGAGITDGNALATTTTMVKEASEFAKLLDSMTGAKEVAGGKLNGDYTSGFAGTFTSESDKAAKPQGAAAGNAQGQTIDRTSKLYEQAMELENYFVKIMLSSMKNTMSSSTIYGEKSYATQMYEDMMFDELSVSLTKNAGFGLADQIYLELNA
ncbi:MAG: rod-binding protein [Treponemataceae bacterium]|nr:rod-binding protein [Treponemataceae bacterium]